MIANAVGAGFEEIVDASAESVFGDLFPSERSVQLLFFVDIFEEASVFKAHGAERDSRHNVIVVHKPEVAETKCLVAGLSEDWVADAWLAEGVESVYNQVFFEF